MNPVFIVGISGGTGSGKTFTAEKTLENLGNKYVVILHQDDYYRDMSHLSFKKREKINFDHPRAFDNRLLVEHLKLLKSRKPADQPLYDFSQHLRLNKSRVVYPKDIVVVEGILIFSNKKIRGQLDLKIFLDVDDDTRGIRRLKRDMAERGRSFESIIKQYIETFQPMHYRFIEKTKSYADIVFQGNGLIFPRKSGHNEELIIR